jgi:hypothetical protein
MALVSLKGLGAGESPISSRSRKVTIQAALQQTEANDSNCSRWYKREVEMSFEKVRKDSQ